MLRMQIGFSAPHGGRQSVRVTDWPEVFATIRAKEAAGFADVRLEGWNGQPRRIPLHHLIGEAWRSCENEARAAMGIFRSYCAEPLPRVPGCDTVLRLAVRIYQGRTIEEAAAAEYTYRWQLALGSEINRLESRSRSRGNVWGFPHAFGL